MWLYCNIDNIFYLTVRLFFCLEWLLPGNLFNVIQTLLALSNTEIAND